MDEYMRTLHSAVDAGAAGDRQALCMAEWLLSELRRRLDANGGQACDRWDA